MNVTAENVPVQPSIFKEYWGGLVFLIFVILGITWSLLRVLTWMGDAKQLPLSQIVVQGQLIYLSSIEVRDAVLQLGQLHSFILQDVDAIHSAIFALPWVANVEVRKQWPNTLQVNVTEYHPEAIWNGSQLLDIYGVAFSANPNDVLDQVLVSLYGPVGSEYAVLSAWREMQRILAPTKLEIVKLVLNDRRSWRMVTQDGTRIELGRDSRKERLERFVNMFDEINKVCRTIQYVDLRYDTGAAIGWKEPNVSSEE
ncbi:cell division protein FtsQ/DivIB [Candidatus Enterovibrio altilux]|uniref:Cell division protein FtsQ n=2 Tax=Candidatus Enterovibrio altilux TaxID=1927128 RepID=A0A291B7K6_9GAMM|nr:cell division protein FtsQ/DivIB [Candidatus Enterovibrio luxaltus]ATF08966.1 Cell division protein FtsQ [Candidatus Enterovibrio luxaltus]